MIYCRLSSEELTFWCRYGLYFYLYLFGAVVRRWIQELKKNNNTLSLVNTFEKKHTFKVKNRGETTTKGGYRRLEKSHKVWMMMIAASWQEQLKYLNSLK